MGAPLSVTVNPRFSPSVLLHLERQCHRLILDGALDCQRVVDRGQDV
jgi:hypothetical protein